MNQILFFPSSVRRGAAAILIVVLTALLFVAVCFSIDIARVQLAQLELQSAADLASRAGAEALSRQVGDPTNPTTTDAAVRDEIEMIANQNRIGHTFLDLDIADEIKFGKATKDANNHYVFTPNAPSGEMDNYTHCVAVFPSIPSYPVIFGSFVNRSNVGLAQTASAMVTERDIVVVLDKSGSMRSNRDAGQISESDYGTYLRQFHDGLNNGDAFQVSGGQLDLTRSQALKLALMMFRREIDLSRSQEQLGLIAYAANADKTQLAVQTNIVADIEYQMPQNLLNLAKDEEPSHFASKLEPESSGYTNFDFNYLALKNGGMTNIAEGIEKGTDILFGAERRFLATPVLIVMTDGVHNEAGTPSGSATIVKNAHPNLRIYTVTFGSGANQTEMQSVAHIGDGLHYHAANVLELVDVFKQLANTAGVTLIE